MAVVKFITDNLKCERSVENLFKNCARNKEIWLFLQCIKQDKVNQKILDIIIININPINPIF